MKNFQLKLESLLKHPAVRALSIVTQMIFVIVATASITFNLWQLGLVWSHDFGVIH